MSMAYKKVRATLAQYWATAWTVSPIAWPNVAFTPPAAAPWVRYALVFAGSERTTITGSRETGQTVYGRLILQFFVPAETGDGLAWQQADAAAALLNERRLPVTEGGHVVLFVPIPQAVGVCNDTNQTWYQVNLKIPFEFLEV